MTCPQGVVTAATSLITTLAQKSPDDFKTSVSLAVARLSRVGLCSRSMCRTYLQACLSASLSVSQSLLLLTCKRCLLSLFFNVVCPPLILTDIDDVCRL